MSKPERVCSICSGKPADLVEQSIYSCGADECEREIDAELRARIDEARQAAEADAYGRYQ